MKKTIILLLNLTDWLLRIYARREHYHEYEKGYFVKGIKENL